MPAVVGRRQLAIALVVLLLAACGGNLKKSATCDRAGEGRSAVHGASSPAAPEQRATGQRSFAPVYCLDLADPFVLRVREALTTKLYVFGTSVPLVNIPVLIPKGILRAERVDDALPKPAPWAGKGGGWAPSVLQRGGDFVLYYTIRDRASGRQCISVAASKVANGPYQDTSTAPLVCPRELGGAIDPSPFVSDDGTAYLYWKNDGNCCDIPTRLWAQQLSDDGRSLVGPPTEVLRADLAWEAGVVEAPSMLELDGALYLFYSANAWSSKAYAIGYATCASPTGPCTKPLDRPWLGSSATVAGPGGQELYVDGGGHTRMVFHGWLDGKVGYADGGHRSLFTTGISIVDGAPVAK